MQRVHIVDGCTAHTHTALPAGIKRRAPLTPARRLFFCNGLYGPTCSNGWWPPYAADALNKQGIYYENCYPYTGAAGCTAYSPCTGQPQVNWKGQFVQYTFTDVLVAKDFIRSGGAIATFMNVYNDFYYVNRTSGIYKWDGVSAFVGGHAVLVIGFNDNEGYW